ncbi:hypothetical protein [Tessaracoccus flavescens]|uniref:hypothetical protein n=1 Tax=Tessaracoccus flavescens TaxID=399497 RepID=UPI0012602E28|nr:hypothetical protein [Tessaracoccus flavescens]
MSAGLYSSFFAPNVLCAATDGKEFHYGTAHYSGDPEVVDPTVLVVLDRLDPLALAFFVDAVNTRLIINMPTEFFERWTGSADPYLPDPEDPAWTDPDHEPPATPAGPEGRAVTTSPATLESIIS